MQLGDEGIKLCMMFLPAWSSPGPNTTKETTEKPRVLNVATAGNYSPAAPLNRPDMKRRLKTCVSHHAGKDA